MGTYTGSDKRLRYLFQNSGGGGGGTTVVANPEGTATDTLNKLQVGSTIYSIPSGGSGENYTTTEQAIGTYLSDTLYRRTVVASSLTMVNGQMLLPTSVFLNINKLIDWKCNLYDPINARNFNIPYIRINDNESLHLQLHRLNDGTVSVLIFSRGAGYNNRTFQNVEFTLEYTKSS